MKRQHQQTTVNVSQEREKEQLLIRMTQLLDRHDIKHALNDEEKRLQQWISDETERCNKNNMTRTEAYLSFYKRNPEIHWSYLAHLVSRNGGWKMTDLKGDLLSRLLSEQEINDFFLMLERCNWLIFYDVFPQLLIYEYSKKNNRPFFHLLHSFNTSVFMQAVWPLFFKKRISPLAHIASKQLTYALIVNEQQFIEKRVIEHPYFQKNVLQNSKFKAQSWLHYNHICFPYEPIDSDKGDGVYDSSFLPYRLAGTIVEQFGDLPSRIEVGKHLYAILFETKEVSESIWQWANQSDHTGSRSDYWPQLFSAERPRAKNEYSFKLRNGQLHNVDKPLFSPKLEEAWRNQDHSIPDVVDWCHHDTLYLIDELYNEISPYPFDITDEELSMLNKMELSIVGKQKL